MGVRCLNGYRLEAYWYGVFHVEPCAQVGWGLVHHDVVASIPPPESVHALGRRLYID